MYSVSPLSNCARALGQESAPFSTSSSKLNVVAFLEGDVEIGSIENLAQFLLDGAQNFVLVEARTDGLADLGEQFVLFGPPLGVMHDDVVFESQADLQGQSDQQPQDSRRRTSGVPHGETATRRSCARGFAG